MNHEQEPTSAIIQNGGVPLIAGISDDDLMTLAKLLWTSGFLSFFASGGSSDPKKAEAAAIRAIAFNLRNYLGMDEAS